MNSNTVAALVRRTKTGQDEFHKAIYSETFTIHPGIFWPASSTEATDGQDQVRWNTTLCLPTGTVVDAVDAVIPQVVVDAADQPVLDDDGKPQGDRYEVDGNPQRWPKHPHDGWQPEFAVVIQLKREVG